MYIPCISNVVDIHGIYVVYPCIYMVYLLTYIHGIYVVYPWIFQAFFSRFLSRSVLLVSFNAHPCVGDQDWFIPRATMAIVPGDRRPTKGSLLLSPRSRRRWRLALRGANSGHVRAPPCIQVRFVDIWPSIARGGIQCAYVDHISTMRKILSGIRGIQCILPFDHFSCLLMHRRKPLPDLLPRCN